VCLQSTSQIRLMNIVHKELLLIWFRSLLVDIREETGVPIGAPDCITYEWCFIEAPLLEKQVLAYIEGTRAENPILPEWLIPLWVKFLSTKEALYLRALRQLLLFCYKVEHEPTTEQLKAAQAEFENTDDSIATWDTAFNSSLSGMQVLSTARQYISSIVSRINWPDILPSHGPGGIFPSRKPSEKSCFRTLYKSITEKYPYDQNYCGIPSFWKEVMVDEVIGPLQEVDYITAKLTAVPKDSRGPRLICVHPAEAIWVQQGQRGLLERAITSHPLTKGKINFTDQTVNGNLALSSSASGYLCTLDLKEASDRMSCQLVLHLFGDYTYNWLSCSRASHIKLLDGRVRELRKWAPMGNCLTFPVQSIVFFALVRAGIRCRYGINCTDVYVFGDDILFPSKYYDGAVRGLAMAGFVPNMAKTFYRGLFRESCGVDAYNGINVTPLRMKKTSIASPQHSMALFDLAKRLRQRGYENCSSAIYSKLREHWGPLPLCNNPNAQGFVEYVRRDLGWILRNEPRCFFDTEYHQWIVQCLLVSSSITTVVDGDWYHLQDSLLRLEHTPKDVISDRGTEYASPYSVRLTYGWVDNLY
jgi:hypothetical protein